MHTSERNYGRFIDGIDLWYSYLLSIKTGRDLVFEIYVWQCGTAEIVFPSVVAHRWVEQKVKADVDPDGSVDYGTLEQLERNGRTNRYRLIGAFGEIEIESEDPYVNYAADFMKW